ncbi:LEPR-XLL domain-containing protein [Pseudomaricurvus sp. HS19]|uniref:LEPR-XLL domain-containing protein n=1 Tax=Pseudomaricurvus sp. HS19 TaxID=2692626 RepID=UPI001367A18D|nr:LEPR-XLL domain-containing protein [Pseudomaricurvus sp. HS19]MYM61955.1 LEPR-XLL domain-containing protein [Pseudomaricurvus sp. HS19]
MGSSLGKQLQHFLKKKLPQSIAAANRSAPAKALYFEALEPRLLLNADLPGVDLVVSLGSDRDHDVVMRLVEEQQLSGDATAALTKLQIIDLSNNNEILASADINTLSSVVIDLGSADDRITVDTTSFGDQTMPAITLQGGDGLDELVVESQSDTVWDIAGTGAGSVSGGVNLAFYGMEKLTGSAGNEDTFVLQEAGSLSGGVDGGAAGFDILEIKGSFSQLTSTVFDASSGVIELDGKLLSYTGLEPINVDGSVSALVLNTGDGDDEIVLEAGTGAGTFALRSANGAFETHVFGNNVASITLGLGSGADSFTSTLTDATVYLGNITIAETVDLTLGDITGLGGNLTVSTISGLHEADGTYLGWEGSQDLDYDGSSVTILDGANIDIAGDLSVTVNANTVMNASNIQEFISAPIVRGVLNVGDSATISANNVTLAVITNGEREMFLGIDTAALIDLAIEDAKAAVATDWTAMTFADQGDGTGTITRTGGSWLTDQFAVGQDLQVSGANSASNQTYRLLAVTDDVVTVDLSDGATMPAATETDAGDMVIEGYQFVRFNGDDEVVFGVAEDGTSLIARTVPTENPDARMNGAPALTFTHFDGAGDTISRAEGSWVADGFVAGQTIAVRDAGGFNGNYTVAGVTASTLTLSAADSVAGGIAAGGVTVRGHTLGSFIYEGFAAGDEIVVQGSERNNKTYTVAEVYDHSLVLIASDDIVGEVVDLSSAAAPELVIQKVKTDLALEDTPLVLMDRNGEIIQTDQGELTMTQAELDEAYNQNSNLWESILGKLTDNGVLDALTNFGLKVWVSDLHGSVNLGSNSTITAGGDVAVTSDVTGTVEASTPSVVLGVSVVRSTVSSSVTMAEGARITAGGAAEVAASADNTMQASMSVTSGSIQNPAQPVASGLLGEGTALDPSGFSKFAVPQVAGSFLGPIGFVRVPGPAVAIALGMADTDSAVTIASGAGIVAGSIDVAATNVYDYGVSASSTIFEPGANMGIGAAVAVSVTDSHSITTVNGDLSTYSGSAGDINISAESTVVYDEVEQPDGSIVRDYTGGNAVSSAAWIRNTTQGSGGLAGALGGFVDSIKARQTALRDATALSDLANENPGKFEMAAGISVLVSNNTADVIVASTRDQAGSGGISADGDLNVFATAVDKPFVGAAACAESGAEIAAAAGIAFARYDNTANTRILADADLEAGGSIYLGANALIPNNITLDETFYTNYNNAVAQFEADKAAADGDAEKLAEAQTTFAGNLAEASKDTLLFFLDAAKNRKWGLAGAEAGLLTTYVNSGAGGQYNSTAKHDEVVFEKDGTTPKFNADGTDKTKQVSNETQSAKYGIAGNISIFEIHNTGTVSIGEDASITAVNTLDVESRAEMDTINMTGLTSLWDIFWSAASHISGADDGASTSGSDGGVGASVGIRVFDSVARNRVAEGATLITSEDSVNLNADTRQLHINITEMGADGGSTGIAGSVAVDVINTTTETLVDESARILAATDIGLHAHSDFLQVNAGLAGTEVEGGIAVGAAVGVNVLNTTTRALVTNLEGSSVGDNSAAITDAAQANIQAGNDVSVTARGEEVVVAVNLAGSHQTEKPAPTQDSGEHDLVWLTRVAKDQQDRLDATRVGIAGAANVDVSSVTVTAAIGAGASVSAGGEVEVQAEQDRVSILVAGGGMLEQSTDGSKAALAGAFDVTVFSREVEALVNGAVIHGAGLDMDADRNDLMVVVSAGGSGSTNSDAAVAGSFNVNIFDNKVGARLTNSVVDVSGDASLKARSDTLLVSVAGAVGVNLGGKAGVGAAVGVSHSDDEVHAYIDNSSVMAGGDVLVLAHNELDVISVVASAGISLKELGIAGQLALHMTTSDVDARIGNDSVVSADNNVAIIADDRVGMVMVTGGIALGGKTAVGIAAASSDIYDRKVQAHIDDGVAVTANAQGDATHIGDLALGAVTVDGLLVKAVGDDEIINIAVGVSASRGTALQGSLIIDTNSSEILAYIGTDAATDSHFASASAGGAGSIVVAADYRVLGVNVVGGVSASMGKLAIGASLNVSTHERTVKAGIGSYAQLSTGGSVLVDASLDAELIEIIFNGGLSKGVGAAGAVSVPVFNDYVYAQAMSHSRITAGDDIAITAGHDFDLIMVDAAVGAGGDVGAGISLGVAVQSATVRALVGNDALLTADDTLVVSAVSDALIASAAGGIAAGGKVGAGASAFLLVRDDDVRAEVATGAALTGLALGSGFSRSGPNGTTVHRGVSVTAESKEKIVGVAVQGSGGGTAGVAGTVAVSVINETTIAHVHDGVTIDSGADIRVKAEDHTELYNIAGNVAGGGTAAVGASFDVASVIKSTHANLGDPDDGSAYVASDPGVTATAGGNVLVEALASEQIVSVAIGIAGAGTAAVGVNGAVYVLGLDTHATIGENARVAAEGSVVLDALQDTEIDMIGASLAGAGTAAIVGTFDIPIVTKAVTATVLEGASVVAHANLPGITVHTGSVSSSKSGAGSSFINTDSGSVSTPTDVIDGSLNLAMPQVDQSEAGMYVARDYSADTASGFTGVSITAVSLDDLQSITGGIAIAGSAGVAAVVGVDVANITTHATVADGVTINLDSAGSASDSQAVNIAAGNALDHMGVLAAVALSGGGSVGLVGDVKALTTDTRASVGDADIVASGDITIAADTEEDVQSLVLSIAGGYIAVAPAVTVISLEATTSATVAGGAMLDAGGNVQILAGHDTNIDTLDGGVAGGVGAVSPGISVIVLEKTTTATVGDNVSIDARALHGSTDGVEGLLVQATSSENLDQVAFGAAAGVVAVGGSASVMEVDSDTIAGINAGARINQKGYAAGEEPAGQQNVQVAAHNVLEVDVVSGGMGIGLVGAGVGVGVLTVNNDTAAYLNGSVSAAGDVSVEALSDQDVHGVIFGGAGGGGALAVAVGIFDIGGDKSGSGYSYTDGEGEEVNSNATTVPSGQDENDASTSNLDAKQESSDAINSGVGELLAGLKTGGDSGGDENLAQLNNNTSSITATAQTPTAGSISTSNTIPTGTSALVGANASITASGNVGVMAYQNANFEAVVGGAAIGGVAASGGVGVATLDNDVLASVGSGGRIYSAGDVTVSALLIERAEFTGFAGAGAIGVALSATVVVLSDYSSVTAELGGSIVEAGDVTVLASSDIGLFAETIQISAAAFGAGGGAATIVSSDGHTTAGLLSGTVISSAATPGAVENVTVQAIGLLEIGDIDRGSGDNNAMATGGSAGGIAVSVGYSGGTDKRDTVAYVGEGSDITANSKVDIQADSSSNLDIVTKGGAGGAVAAGLMFANAAITDSYTSATVKSNSRIRATDITVAAKGDKLANAQTLAVAVGGVAVGGTNATTTVTANVDAAVDTGVEMIAGLSITVKAESDIEGDAFVESVSVGIVSAGGSTGFVTVTPTTTSSVSDNARLSSGGDIAVYTKSGQAEVVVSTVVNNDYLTDDNLIKVYRRDVISNKLMGYQVDPVTGAPVYELDDNGEPTSNRVLVYGDAEGNWVTAAGESVAADSVQLLYQILNLKTGDVIQLHEVGTVVADPTAEPVGGEYLDRNLSVIRVDRETVSIGTVILGQEIDTDRDTITVQQPHNFVTGDVATITDPESLVFGGGSINYNDQGTIWTPANSIYIPNHGLQNGDAFVYSAGDVPIKGLVDGQVYYAITRGSDYLGFAATLADTYPGVQRLIDLSRWGDEDGTITVAGSLSYEPGDVRYADWVSEESGQPANSFYIPGHNLVTGDMITFAGSVGVGSNWTGKTFAVIAQGDDFIQLAQSKADAFSGKAFDLQVTFEPALYYYTQSRFDTGQVDVAANALLLEGYDFQVGDEVRYLAGDQQVGGLSAAETYRVASVINQWVTLETLDSSPVDIATPGNGSIALAGVVDFHPQWISGDDFNLQDDGLEVPPDSLFDPRHNLKTGDQVRVSVPVQSGISGLLDNQFYFVIVTGDYLQFATSLENADAGVWVDLSANTASAATFQQQQTFSYADITFDTGEGPVNSIFVAGHNYTTGMRVEVNSEDVPVLGLPVGDYYAIVIDESHIRLANSLVDAEAGVAIDLAPLGTPFINVSGVLEVELGEQRITPLLDDGLAGQYRVTVIDAFTFKLQDLAVANGSDQLTKADFDQLGVNKNPGDIYWDGGIRSTEFQVGDYITYYEEGLVETVSASMLGKVPVERDFERGNGNTTIDQYEFEEGSNNIYVPGHGYATGDIVEYQSANGNAGGLTAINPGRYSVVVVDDNLFTLHYLVADATHNVGDEVNVWANIEWYEANPGSYGIDGEIDPTLDLGSIHKVVNGQLVGVDGLVHGHGYYVIDTVAGDGYLNLSLTENGDALEFVAREGTVTFSREGLNLSRSWGEFQALLDFSQLAGKDIEVLGEDGVRLSEVLNDVGDSKSSLTLRNTSGGAVNVGTSEGHLTIDVTLDTTIEGELLAQSGILVDSENKTFGSIDNRLVGIGVLGGGKNTGSFLDYTENQTVHITDAVLDAGYAIAIKAETAPNMTTVANGRGGGLVDLNFANADTTVNIQQNKVIIDGSSTLVAAGRGVTDFDGNPLPGLSVQAITGGLASNSSTASNGGVVAGLQINARGDYETSFTAHTGVSIGEQASLEAYELLIEAKNTGIDLDSTAHLSMGGLFAGGTAAAKITANLYADVSLSGAATLTGSDGVKIKALNVDNTFDTSTTMYIIALGGGEGWAQSGVNTWSTINAAAGTTVYAGADAQDDRALVVIAEDGNNTINSRQHDVMIGAIHTNNSRNPVSEVNWDADVHISAIRKPFGLVVSGSGLVLATQGVTVNGGYGTGYQITDDFYVDDISGQPLEYGKTVIEANSQGNNRTVTGSDGTFFYNTQGGLLEIANYSAYDMTINNIDMYGQGGGSDGAEITIDANTRTLSFDIAFEVDGSEINIYGLTDVGLAGHIDNSKGRTTVTSALGSIKLAGSGLFSSFIESQEVALSATIGSVDALVALVSDATEAKLEVDALFDVSLLIANYVIRDNASFFVNAENPLEIDTLGDVNIVYLSPFTRSDDVVTGGAIGVTAQNNDSTISAESGFYSGHYSTGKVGSVADAPIEVSFGDVGEQIDSMLIADISASNISFSGLGEKPIDLRLTSDILGDGAINVTNTGSVAVTESTGDLRVGRIATSYELSLSTPVVLTALDGGVVDAYGDPEADVLAHSVYIGRSDFIGSVDNPLEIAPYDQDSSTIKVTARATGDIYLTQTRGDLSIGEIAAGGDAGIETVNGSILAGEPGLHEEFDVKGVNVSLAASGGTIGSPDYYLDIVTGYGVLNAFSDETIYLVEQSGTLHVQSLVSGADINLHMGDQNPEVDEATLLHLIEGGVISAQGAVEIYVADDFHAAADSQMIAGSTLALYGDAIKIPRDTITYFVGDMELDGQIALFSQSHINIEVERTNVTGGYWMTVSGDRASNVTPDDDGAHLLFEGLIATQDGASIYGADDQDLIHFRGATLSGIVTAFGGDNNDTLMVTRLAPMSAPIESQVDGSITGRDVLNLVGGDGVDHVTIYTHGSGDTSNQYVINIDSDAVDAVAIHGADDSDDIFLLRETVGVASYPGSFNMVSVINGTLPDATTSGGPESVQRINISTNLDRLWIAGGSGNDYFAVDSFVHTELVFAGGEGVDTYALGQYFGSKRDAGAQVAALDHFTTATRTIDGTDVEESPGSDKPVLILDGYNGTSGEPEDQVILSSAGNMPVGVNRAEVKLVAAVLMPGELNEIAFDTLPDAGEILRDEDGVLLLQDTLSSYQSSIDLVFTAADSDLTGFAFDTDTSAIRMIGLASTATVNWSVVNGALVANDGNQDVLRLEIVAAPIAANSSGNVRVTATMLGAFSHESIINVDTLAITGITLLATDATGQSASSGLRIMVADAVPQLSVEGGGLSGSAGELLSGSWSGMVGADLPGDYTVLLDGIGYGLDEAIAIVRDGVQVGTLTVKSSGVWEVVGADSLQDLYINQSYVINFMVFLQDSDLDSVSGSGNVTLIGAKVPEIPAIGEDAFLSVTDTTTTDVHSVELTYTAGGLDLVSVGFDNDFSTIQLDGLDDAAVMNWSLVDGALVGNNGISNVIMLEVSADRIAALTSGKVTVSVTLMGALAHEDSLNVDQLTISGIGLVAIDSAGFELHQSATVTVYDSLPTISANQPVSQVLQGETISGTWSYDAGADGLGLLGVRVDNMDYALDTAIAVFGDGRQIGQLTVSSDGTWQLQALPDLWTVDGAAALYQLGVEIMVADSDQDTAAVQFGLAVEVPAVVFAQIETGTVVLDEDLIVDEKSIDLAVKTGTFALATVAFNSDTSGIQIDGLDNAAAISWRIDESGALIGNDGTGDVIQLTLTYENMIQAQSEGVVRLTATLLGAMSHEDMVNVDSLSISGVSLVLMDSWGYSVAQTVGISVLDDEPVVGLSTNDYIGNYKGGEVHSGTWNVDMGADADGAIMVVVNGQQYAIGETIEVVFDTDYVGDLTVHDDGTWTFVAQKKTYDETAVVLDISFELVAVDADGDQVADDTTFTVTRILGRANNGVGNGLDPQPPGLPPENDTGDAVPGDPGNEGGADYDSELSVSTLEFEDSESTTIITATASSATPSTSEELGDSVMSGETWLLEEESLELAELSDEELASAELVAGAETINTGEEWQLVS